MPTPDKQLAATCGLFCPACSVYIATTEDPQRLAQLAARFGLTQEQMRCTGCHSDTRGPYCSTCKMVVCAAEKGVDFCGACDEYPCEDLKVFQTQAPHRIDLWASQERIAQVGYERWCEEMLVDYSCPQCGTINSAYDLACRKCGAEPSCPYVSRNRAAIEAYLSQG